MQTRADTGVEATFRAKPLINLGSPRFGLLRRRLSAENAGCPPCADRRKRRNGSMARKAKIGVLGASGYTGAELLRLLISHPRVEVALLTADRKAGQEIGAVFPQFAHRALPKLVAIDAVDWAVAGLDLAFCALPHAT